MAWGKSAEPSTFSKVFPLVVFLTILSVVGWVGYHVYLSWQEIRTTAAARMNKKNVVFTKDGLKVGVKHIEDEKYLDKTQRYFVKAWNMGNSTVDPTLKKI